MSKNSFINTAAVPTNPNWEKLISRRTPLYERPVDVRSPFARDYTRILHSLAYRRLKHKTQVFFNIDNDHICTRMEHVAHVESVSSTIAKYLGLNDELTKAISIGHDLFYPQLGVKLCSMAGGGVQKIYMVFFKRTVPAGQVRQ